MVRISTHIQTQKRMIQDAKISMKRSKYAFSPAFSVKLYEFSERFHTTHFKVFNRRFEEWLLEHRDEVEDEMAHMQSSGFYGSIKDVMQKIKVSARFYYCKKSKKAAKKGSASAPQVKPYIGLSAAFIRMMDEFVTNKIITGKVIKKEMFTEFSFSHVCEIKDELKGLKEKYDVSGNVFKPVDIAKKFKKAFDNRFHLYYNTNTNTNTSV